MKMVLPALVLALLLFGCLIIEDREATPMQGGAHTYNVSQEVPPQETPPQEPPAQNLSNVETLPEPVEASPEVRMTLEREETGEGTIDKQYSGVEFADYTLLLDDLALQGDGYCTVVKIVTIEGVAMHELDRAQICPGESHYWVSPEQHKYRIKVIETASGYSDGAAWADIIIYS